MTQDIVPLKRALISVSDKTGLIDFARALDAKGVEILSTGGTAKALREAGIAVKDVAEITGFPEMMDGRVKTLHPVVHGGLLALRDDAGHQASAAEHGIGMIDLLVVNLYPFEETVAKGGSYDDCVENIDIGGPAMIRAAAKNHKFVNVVTDPHDYSALLVELKANGGATSYAFRRKLALTAYSRTAAYDAAVSAWMAGAIKEEAPRRRAFAGQLAHGSLAGIENRRYDRRDNDALDALRINLIKIQKIFEFHAVLVRGLEQVGRHAGLDENAVVLHTAEHDVGIADIDR